MNPYRETGLNTKRPMTVRIKTNDVKVVVIYKNVDDNIKTKSISFLGEPTAHSYSSSNEISKFPSTGMSAFMEWYVKIGERQFAVLEGLIIPMHRVMEITYEQTDREEEVEVKPVNR